MVLDEKSLAPCHTQGFMTNRKMVEQQSKGSLPKPGTRQTLVMSYDRITLICVSR
jgi:hypothetical protein